MTKVQSFTAQVQETHVEVMVGILEGYSQQCWHSIVGWGPSVHCNLPMPNHRNANPFDRRTGIICSTPSLTPSSAQIKLWLFRCMEWTDTTSTAYTLQRQVKSLLEETGRSLWDFFSRNEIILCRRNKKRLTSPLAKDQGFVQHQCTPITELPNQWIKVFRRAKYDKRIWWRRNEYP